MRNRSFKYKLLSVRSHPSWVRGLKSLRDHLYLKAIKSHPSWVRGLKYLFDRKYSQAPYVAPFVGAGIEIAQNPCPLDF